ncbi:hypothetical protein BGX38DRAFT_1256518 [Terfezia claveryi]|nr:hypothetical protein BGX38DRAFT_1256518 [Terfezia claveryi]
MFALLLHILSHLPTAGELPSWRRDASNLLFNPPIEHKFPSILSIDAPPARLTLDGPTPPLFFHPAVVESPAYYIALENEDFYPPSKDQNQIFRYFLVVCFLALMLWQFLEALHHRKTHGDKYISGAKLNQGCKLEIELPERDLEVLELRRHLHEATARAGHLSAEAVIAAHRLEEVVASEQAELALSRRLRHQVEHNISHYQRCLGSLVEETVKLSTQRDALQREVEQQRQESLQLLQRRHLAGSGLCGKQLKKHTLRVSEELLKLKLDEIEQRLAIYKTNDSSAVDSVRVMRKQRSEENIAFVITAATSGIPILVSVASTLVPAAPANTVPVPAPIAPAPAVVATVPLTASHPPANPRAAPVSPISANPRPAPISHPTTPGPSRTPFPARPSQSTVRRSSAQATTSASARRARQPLASPIIVPAQWALFAEPKVIRGGGQQVVRIRGLV